MSRPRLGLGSRLTLLTAGGFVALQVLGVAALLVWNAQETGRWRPPFGDRLAAMAQSLEATPPGAGRERLLRAFTTSDTRVRMVEASPPAGWTRPALGRRAARPLPYGSALEGRSVEILVRRSARWRPRGDGWGRQTAVVVALRGGGQMMVEAGAEVRRQAVFYSLLGINILAGLLILALVWRSARAMAAPLQAIADRADRFAFDLQAEPMPEGGPPEAAAVAAAFNRLRDRVRGLMADRLRMLAAIAHDLRTYLTRLRIRAALIADADQREMADRDIRQMSALIEDVLLVARGEERPPVLGQVDLVGLLEEIAQARSAAEEAVSLAPSDLSVTIRAEEAGLRRAVENLLDNAMKYAGSAELRIIGAPEAWIVEVIDHGPGLPEGFEAEAFDPFARGETSRSRQTGGAGLGLAIARGLVRASGGEVLLAPTPGGGLTARLLLPR